MPGNRLAGCDGCAATPGRPAKVRRVGFEFWAVTGRWPHLSFTPQAHWDDPTVMPAASRPRVGLTHGRSWPVNILPPTEGSLDEESLLAIITVLSHHTPSCVYSVGRPLGNEFEHSYDRRSEAAPNGSRMGRVEPQSLPKLSQAAGPQPGPRRCGAVRMSHPAPRSPLPETSETVYRQRFPYLAARGASTDGKHPPHLNAHLRRFRAAMMRLTQQTLERMYGAPDMGSPTWTSNMLWRSLFCFGQSSGPQRRHIPDFFGPTD